MQFSVLPVFTSYSSIPSRPGSGSQKLAMKPIT